MKYLVGRTAGMSGLIAAIVATHIATMAGYWFGAVKLPAFGFNHLNGWIVFNFLRPPFDTFSNPTWIVFVVGGAVHYINGILWGLIFALVISPMMGRWSKRLAPMTPTNNYLKGVIWGWALWIISSAVWMPLVAGSIPGIQVGAFLTNFGKIGVQAVFTNFLWHTIYGVNLGLLFNPTSAAWAAEMGAPKAR